MLQSLFQNKAGLNSGMPMEPWQAPQTDQRKTINSTLPSIMGTQTPTVQQTAVPQTTQTTGFNGTAPELDWATFEQHLLNPYLQNGWIPNNVADTRNSWANQLGLDVGGKPTLQIGDLDWGSFANGATTGNLDDMGMPAYMANPNAAANREAAYKAALANPDTIYKLGTDRIGAGGTNAGGGTTRTDVEYKRVGNKLVPVNQRDFTKSGYTKDTLTGLALMAAVVSGAGAMGLTGEGAAAGGLSGMDLAADAALGSGNNVMTAGQALTGSGGLAGTGIPAFTQAPGYGETVATLADASGASPFTGAAAQGGAAFDPLAAYMTTGASEGSTIGGALLGGGGAGAVGQGTVAGTLGSLMANPITNFLGKRMAGTVAGNIVGNILGGDKGSGVSTAGNLGSLFSNYNQYKNMGGLIDEIRSIYKPDGAYAKTLENELARRDAAAGRNSQYGPRLTELMGRLGDSQARALSGLGGMYATQQGGMNGMIGAGTRLAGDLGLTDWLGDTLGGMFSSGIPAGSLGTTPAIWDRPEEDIDWEELFGG